MTHHPPIDFSQLRIDPVRLDLALGLTVAAIETVDTSTGELVPREGCYAVTPVGKSSEKLGFTEHSVDLYSSDVPRCDCADHTFRQVICKHMLACLLVEGHPVVVAALRESQGKLARQLEGSLSRA
jgi:hypothetical protein